MNLLLVGILLAIIAVAYQIGLTRSRSIAGKGNNSAMLHSRPGYYGTLVALWCGIPAALLLFVWNFAEPSILRHVAMGEIPAQIASSLSATELDVILRRIQSIASASPIQHKLMKLPLRKN